MNELTYKELAEQLIFEGYFMPEFSWQQYEEDLRWDLHIDEKELERYAKEHNISLIVEKEEDLGKLRKLNGNIVAEHTAIIMGYK